MSDFGGYLTSEKVVQVDLYDHKSVYNVSKDAQIGAKPPATALGPAFPTTGHNYVANNQLEELNMMARDPKTEKLLWKPNEKLVGQDCSYYVVGGLCRGLSTELKLAAARFNVPNLPKFPKDI